MKNRNTFKESLTGMASRHTLYALLLDALSPFIILLLLVLSQIVIGSAMVDLENVQKIALGAREDIQDDTELSERFDIQNLIDARKNMHRALLKMGLWISASVFVFILAVTAIKGWIWSLLRNEKKKAIYVLRCMPIPLILWVIYSFVVVYSSLNFDLMTLGIIMGVLFLLFTHVATINFAVLKNERQLSLNLKQLFIVGFEHPYPVSAVVGSTVLSILVLSVGIVLSANHKSITILWVFFILFLGVLHYSRLVIYSLVARVSHG